MLHSESHPKDLNCAWISLADILSVRGGPLKEDEVWALLSAATERILKDGNRASGSWMTVSPWSFVLSGSGNLIFHNVSHPEAATFRAPEIFQIPSQTTKMLVYSLGMTLYWAPVNIGQALNSILIFMCERSPEQRPSPEMNMKKCQEYQKIVSLPSSAFSIQELVNPKQEDSIKMQYVQSQKIRERLRQKQEASLMLSSTPNLSSAGRRSLPWLMSDKILNNSDNRNYHLSVSSLQSPAHKNRIRHQAHFHQSVQNLLTPCSSCHWEGETFSKPTPSVQNSIFHQRKIIQPEFVLYAKEPPVTLELPTMIVNKKGKSYLCQQSVYVIVPSGLCLEIKCDIRSRVQTVFESTTAYLKLDQPFYFGLAHMKGKEFFFLDEDDVLEKVAPDGWSKTSKNKLTIVAFTLFFRIKFFAQNFSILPHCTLTHLVYLQLRKDVLEGRLFCNREISLQMGSLAVQADIGDYTQELYKGNYINGEYFLPPGVLESPLAIQELEQLHQSHFGLAKDEAELAFLQIAQQCPEYGVLFYNVVLDKPKAKCGGHTLGICCQGIILYVERPGSKTASLHFPWREIQTLSSHRKKFTVLSCSSGKKHSFLTDSEKTSKYLLGLCSELRTFNSKQPGGMLTCATENRNSHHNVQKDQLMVMQGLSQSENILCFENSNSLRGTVLSKSWDTISGDDGTGEESREFISMAAEDIQTEAQRPRSDYLSIHSSRSASCNIRSSFKDTSCDRAEREIIRVKLKRDAKHGLGFMIIGGENIGKLDLGIFVASLIPGGPAECDGRIKTGGRLISMNNISLEGVSFKSAVQILQGCGEEAELIISQPKVGSSQCMHIKRQNSNISCEESENSSLSLGTEQVMEKTDTELKPGAVFSVQLKRENGSLGFSVTGGVNTSVRHGGIYIKNIIVLGPASLNGQIRRGDRLLEVNTVHMLGFTHRQAVECLKNAGEVVNLVLQSGGGLENTISGSGHDCTESTRTTPSCTESNNGWLATKDNTFQVTLRKNSGGLGFSFVQTEFSASGRTGNIVRIKRLFQGQPAEESGQISPGDVLLAVNGQFVQGISYQEVQHLLHGAPSQVTLLICRPEQGILPDLDFTLPTPMPSPVRDILRIRSPDCDLERAVSELDPTPTRELTNSPVTIRSQASEIITALAQDVQLNCYSTCEQESKEIPDDNRAAAEVVSVKESQILSDEEYLTISSASITPSSWGEAFEEETTIHGTPQPRAVIPLPESFASPELCGSESEWEDIEEDENAGEKQSAILGLSVEQLVPPCRRTPSPSKWLLPPATSSRKSQVPSPTRRTHILSAALRIKPHSPTRNVTFNTPTIQISAPSSLQKPQLQSPSFIGNPQMQSFLTDESQKSYETLLSEPIPLHQCQSSNKDQIKKRENVLHPESPDHVQNELIVHIDDEAWPVDYRSPQQSVSRDISPSHSTENVCDLNQCIQGESSNNLLILSYESKTFDTSYIDSKHKNKGLFNVSSDHKDDEEPKLENQAFRTQQSYPVLADKAHDDVSDGQCQINGPQQEYNHDTDNINTNEKHQERETAKETGYPEFQNSRDCAPNAQYCLFNIGLDKPCNGSLGFSLAGGKNGGIFTIKAISPESVSAEDGRLCIGDVLLEVNGHAITGLTHGMAVGLLREAVGKVYLTVHRSTPDCTSYKHHLQRKGGRFSRTEINSDDKDTVNSSIKNVPVSDILVPEKGFPSENASDTASLGIQEGLAALIPCPDLLNTEEKLPNLAVSRQYSYSEIQALILTAQQALRDESVTREFVALEHEKPADCFNVASAPENRNKNRYRDVLPYDNPLVRVGNDGYINASYVTIPVGERELHYICTQGPLPNTVDSFWQMVWENHSAVIIMMTQQSENGKVKCEQYWPEESQGACDGEPVSLRMENCTILQDFTIRIINMSHRDSGENRLITHLQFTSWPDHCTPKSPQSLLRFISYLQSLQNKGPWVVHCSAGIGRTGVLVCVHVILTCLENGIPFQIQDIVKTMRQQRYGMIRTKDQYLFCYKALLISLRLLPYLNDIDLCNATKLNCAGFSSD
ncbi:hypothetical protein GDO86_013029 [Hymenochirus boettgeri]|uniref:Uncharacterized protein n=1 Tax=Hymenochirus boettgeri TaxID=247094 RepID=A0A8T2ITL8_9PIPI|nr:hypothetical protein GDO86_013029 [Hymenochirus boettgeri]